MTSDRVVKVFFYESYINVYVLKEADTASLTNVEEILSNQITIFKDRVRIDVQTSTPGLRFQDAWKRRKTMEYQGQSFYVASREDLISTKRAAGRDVDLEDVRLLELPDEEKDK